MFNEFCRFLILINQKIPRKYRIWTQEKETRLYIEIFNQSIKTT